MATIRWLHFSDLHYRLGSDDANFNREIVLEALWTDLQSQIDKGLRPDLIFFTGDVAHHGQSQEYELAIKNFFEPLLEIVGLSKERLFIVPGNHDIDWGQIDVFNSGAMLQCLENRDNANRFLGPNFNRDQYFGKFHAYSDFVNTYFGEILTFNPVNYFHTRCFELQGVKLGILGLNSAWMSACTKSGQTALDQGHLLIGERQLEEALKQIGAVDLCIALLHHPLEWLHETDRFEIEKRLNSKCDFILHGHWHIPHIRVEQSVAGQAVYIPAGAVYTNRNYPNGYNFAEVDPDTGQIKIYLRRYNNTGAKGPEWTQDILSTGEANAGVLGLEFSGKDRFVASTPNKKKILLVENDFQWEQIVKELLSPDFYIEVAQSYRAAKTQIRKQFDLVILNLCLQGNTDLLGLQVLKDLGPDIPCVLFTGNSTSLKPLFERYPSVCDAFTKGESFRSSEFIETVNRVMGLVI